MYSNRIKYYYYSCILVFYLLCVILNSISKLYNMNLQQDNESLISQYTSVQKRIINTLKLIVDYKNNNDDIETLHDYKEYIKENNNYLQTLRIVKMNLENINDGNSKRIIENLEDDEKTLIGVNDLLHRKIRNASSATLPSSFVPNIIQQYNVIDKLNDLVDKVGFFEFRNTPYAAELERLMNVNVFQIRLHNRVNLNRLDCAAIILQALIKENNRSIDFSKFVHGDSPLMLEKLKCLLYYVFEVCKFMVENDEVALTTPISIHHYIIDPKTISLGDNYTNINIDNVFVDKFAPYNKYEAAEVEESTTYTILYINGNINDRMFDEYATHQDVWYMKCPELYVLPHFIKDKLGENESYIIHNVKQYNILTNQSYNTKRVHDAEMYNKPLPMQNFLIYESCDYKTYTDIDQSDIKHLDREIAKLMSGIHYEQATSSNTSLIFRSGPHNCHDNRTFQFLIEVLVCSNEGSKLYYCASNFEQQNELNDTLECIQNYTVSQLYNKLANYNFNTTGPMNFYRSR
uniref:Sf51 n=1 Tax=Spodoptera frugiperda nuclear polyhedrosis virus TaxID=10455 RepID=B2KWY4_NPVSF|nr:unknown [Spodoptera frugiperda multiple nucleopolyhedrovirus]QRN46163.1 Sf51 [Spodoptera frugiperda multiple nucleopolyhedrovirus]QWS70805.1 hypothetical protein [Spodoptera frugiperda multiple nucleopolyhedrovirus]